ALWGRAGVISGLASLRRKNELTPITDQPPPPGGRVLAHHAVPALEEVALVDLARIVGHLPPPPPLLARQLNLFPPTRAPPTPPGQCQAKRGRGVWAPPPRVSPAPPVSVPFPSGKRAPSHSWRSSRIAPPPPWCPRSGFSRKPGGSAGRCVWTRRRWSRP